MSIYYRGKKIASNNKDVIVERDHNNLINKDMEDQHPISAITGLQYTLDNKQPKGNYALKSDLENIETETRWGEISGNIANQSDLQNIIETIGTALNNATPLDQFNIIVEQSTQAINNLERTKQPIGDYALKSDLDNISVNVSEEDNLYKDNDILKVFTEAGNSAITSRFARLLNLPQGEWKSLVTDTGVLILYNGSISYRTTNGVDFKQVLLPASPSDMAKNYETQTIYCTVASSAGMWMFSTDDGLTWTYNTEKTLGSLAWNKVCIRNNGSQKTGWSSSMCFIRAGGATTQNFANFLASANKFELNNNSKKRIDFVTPLNYDYWCANIQGEVFKTTGGSTFTFYETTKYGLTHIENCDGTIFCGFQDGTIAECMGYQKPWTYYTVASGEKVTDIKYRDGVYYVVTNGANFYTSTDKINWTKTAVLNSYGGKLEFTRFGIVQVTEKPVLLPSRQRLEDLLLYFFDRTDFAKVCGAGLKFEDGQIKVDIVPNIPIVESQGRLNINNIPKTFLAEEVIRAIISTNYIIDYCPADNYDGWLWGNMETGYWDSELWKDRSALWICTGDGVIYDPISYAWPNGDLEVKKYDVVRIIYSEYGDSCTGEIIGNLQQLFDFQNSTGGTSDYTLLFNKPSINGVELTGDKTPSQLDLALSSDLLKTNLTISTVKMNIDNLEKALPQKQDKLIVGNNIIIDNNVISASAMPIGSYVSLSSTSNYIPKNCLLCDGAEYSKTKFNDFYNNYLTRSTGSVFCTINNNTIVDGKISNFNSPITINLIKPKLVTIQIVLVTGDDITTKQLIYAGITNNTVLYIENGNLYTKQGLLGQAQANTMYHLYFIRSDEFEEYENPPTMMGLLNTETGEINWFENETWQNNYQYDIAKSDNSNFSQYGTFLGYINTGFDDEDSDSSVYVDLDEGQYLLFEQQPQTLSEEGNSKLATCTYEEYANEITSKGYCDKFAVAEETFKVPTILDKDNIKTFVYLEN